MDLMLNTYVPFPRYENAVFFGDKAAETLAALRIFGRALIGGDVPSMETLHPAEKMLECTQCALRNRPKILDAAVRRMHADYVLLEANGRIGLDPSVLAAPLAAYMPADNPAGPPPSIITSYSSLFFSLISFSLQFILNTLSCIFRGLNQLSYRIIFLH